MGQRERDIKPLLASAPHSEYRAGALLFLYLRDFSSDCPVLHRGCPSKAPGNCECTCGTCGRKHTSQILPGQRTGVVLGNTKLTRLISPKSLIEDSNPNVHFVMPSHNTSTLEPELQPGPNLRSGLQPVATPDRHHNLPGVWVMLSAVSHHTELSRDSLPPMSIEFQTAHR